MSKGAKKNYLRKNEFLRQKKIIMENQSLWDLDKMMKDMASALSATLSSIKKEPSIVVLSGDTDEVARLILRTLMEKSFQGGFIVLKKSDFK